MLLSHGFQARQAALAELGVGLFVAAELVVGGSAF